MILTIKGADFSSANIGTLSTYIISKSIGSGATFEIPNFVDKNSSVNWTITLDEGYTFGTYSVTMGGVEVTPTVVDNVMTISIAEVTGNVRIVVATVYNGVEDLPEVPDNGENNDNIVGQDITSLFTWNTGGAIEATIISKPGQVFNTPLFNYTDYFDVTSYPDFRMSFVKWTSSTGNQPTLGYALYDENKNYISGVQFEKADPSVGNSAGEVITIDVHITDPSVKYIRTCYPSDSSKYGTFSAVTISVDGEVNEPEGSEDRIDVTNLFTFTDGAAIETYSSNAGKTYTTNLFKYSDYVDVSDMPNFEMSFVKWRSSSGSKASLGYALYDENKNYVSGYAFELADASVGNSAGEPYMIEVNITDPTVKYIRTCYPVDETKYGEFEAYKYV
jgi:hypothetical protein